MDTINTNTDVPTILGTPFAGGYYAGRILVAGEAFALVVAPKAEGEHDETALSSNTAKDAGALSFFDGAGNTAALAEAGSELAKWAQGLAIGGFTDWYLPSRDELELAYRAFKPSDEENYCGSGDNPSSIPVGYAYSLDAPARTDFELFQEGGREAFETDWYWSSTQSAGDESYAWAQGFDSGYQDDGPKDDELRARAVRRLKI